VHLIQHQKLERRTFEEVGIPWEEEQVLAVAAALERECGAWKIPPIR